MMAENFSSRREFLIASGAILGGACVAHAQATAPATKPATTQAALPPYDGPIIDIHQHTTYHGRSDEALLHHQKRMGVTQTLLLPSGSPVDSPATLKGKANGLYAGAGVIDTVIPIVKAHPGEYYFYANEV